MNRCNHNFTTKNRDFGIPEHAFNKRGFPDWAGVAAENAPGFGSVSGVSSTDRGVATAALAVLACISSSDRRRGVVEMVAGRMRGDCFALLFEPPTVDTGILADNE